MTMTCTRSLKKRKRHNEYDINQGIKPKKLTIGDASPSSKRNQNIPNIFQKHENSKQLCTVRLVKKTNPRTANSSHFMCRGDLESHESKMSGCNTVKTAKRRTTELTYFPSVLSQIKAYYDQFGNDSSETSELEGLKHRNLLKNDIKRNCRSEPVHELVKQNTTDKSDGSSEAYPSLEDVSSDSNESTNSNSSSDVKESLAKHLSVNVKETISDKDFFADLFDTLSEHSSLRIIRVADPKNAAGDSISTLSDFKYLLDQDHTSSIFC